MNFAPKKF